MMGAEVRLVYTRDFPQPSATRQRAALASPSHRSNSDLKTRQTLKKPGNCDDGCGSQASLYSGLSATFCNEAACGPCLAFASLQFRSKNTPDPEKTGEL